MTSLASGEIFGPTLSHEGGSGNATNNLLSNFSLDKLLSDLLNRGNQKASRLSYLGKTFNL